jgi:hypothetical protein
MSERTQPLLRALVTAKTSSAGTLDRPCHRRAALTGPG